MLLTSRSIPGQNTQRRVRRLAAQCPGVARVFAHLPAYLCCKILRFIVLFVVCGERVRKERAKENEHLDLPKKLRIKVDSHLRARLPGKDYNCVRENEHKVCASAP